MDRMGTMVCTAGGALLRGGCGQRMRRRLGPSAAPRANAQERMDFGVVGVEARIGGDDVRGSGFVIDGERGLVLTAAHTRLGRALAQALDGARRAARPDRRPRALRRPRGARALSAHPGPGGAADRSRRAPPATQLLRSLGRRHDRAKRGGRGRQHPGRATATPPIALGRRSRCRPRGIPLDSPLVPEVSGGPVRRPGRPARRDGAGDERPARRRARGRRAVGARSASGWTELQPGPRSVYVGWADQYRCVGRQDAYAREMHPGYQLAMRASTCRSRRRGFPEPKGWTADDGDGGRTAGPTQRLPRWAIAAAGVVMVVFLLAPGGRGAADARTGRWSSTASACAAGQLPTDVAVDGSTVWVVSGRDNRVVALDARDAEQAPEPHADRRVAAAARGRPGLGVDGQRGRRHGHAPRPAACPAAGAGSGSAPRPSTSRSAPRARG